MSPPTHKAIAVVGPIHPKAMPVVLDHARRDRNLDDGSPEEALKLQRPLPDGMLRIFARGKKARRSGLTRLGI
jgi:putative SOS response-associated peptidase YedK